MGPDGRIVIRWEPWTGERVVVHGQWTDVPRFARWGTANNGASLFVRKSYQSDGPLWSVWVCLNSRRVTADVRSESEIEAAALALLQGLQGHMECHHKGERS